MKRIIGLTMLISIVLVLILSVIFGSLIYFPVYVIGIIFAIIAVLFTVALYLI